jgi:hypothetical protein
MIFLPDTNACINLLRERNPKLVARWLATKVSDIVLCYDHKCCLRVFLMVVHGCPSAVSS